MQNDHVYLFQDLQSEQLVLHPSPPALECSVDDCGFTTHAGVPSLDLRVTLLATHTRLYMA